MAKRKLRQTCRETAYAREERHERQFRETFENRSHFNILPKNEKQDILIRSIKCAPITVTIGCAGTGKTYCSAGTVAQLFLKGGYKKIVLTRANVPTGKSLGHFPGNIKEKMTPWLLPMMEVLRKALGSGKMEYMLAKEQIEIQPIETIRGRSYENALVLVDESQNLNMDELKAITTRIGENTKLVLMGDPTQSDVKYGKDLMTFCWLCRKHGLDVPVIEFGVQDIVRSDIVADLVKMFIEEKV
jgi:phosphate starvation-inducible PhoH-like protein